jgi:hypothetical protein
VIATEGTPATLDKPKTSAVYEFFQMETIGKRHPYFVACISAIPGQILVIFSVLKILLLALTR